MSPPFSVLKKKPSLLVNPEYGVVRASKSYASTLKIEVTCSSGVPVNFNGIHGDLSQKIELFNTSFVFS
jgi:hypothetical protein